MKCILSSLYAFGLFATHINAQRGRLALMPMNQLLPRQDSTFICPPGDFQCSGELSCCPTGTTCGEEDGIPVCEGAACGSDDVCEINGLCCPAGYACPTVSDAPCVTSDSITNIITETFASTSSTDFTETETFTSTATDSGSDNTQVPSVPIGSTTEVSPPIATGGAPSLGLVISSMGFTFFMAVAVVL